ncbi:hypothetical protein HK101_011138, partial [Irineochytrium annulatum]
MLDILALESMETETIELIRKSDVYSFLVFLEHATQPAYTDTVTSDKPDEGALDMKPASTKDIKLAFRHISIMHAIYDSLAFEERIKMNLLVAERLEHLLREDNQDSLLPSIEFHYSRAGATDKIIQYREMLG